MKNNVYLKSFFRQFIRMAIMLLLIGIGTFFFTSRVVEYQIITIETARIEAYYRSIGYFKHSIYRNANVVEAAKIVSQSSYFAFENHLQYGFATLNDIHNADVRGTGRGLTCHRPLKLDIRDSDAFSYVKLLSIEGPIHDRGISEYYFYKLHVLISVVVAGYPEHLLPGYELIIHWLTEDGATEELIELLEMDTYYFVRVASFSPPTVSFHLLAPGFMNRLYLMPLSGDNLWFVSVAEGEEVDFSEPKLAHILDDIDILNINQHAMRVGMSTDLGALPQTQEVVDQWYLEEGRWVNYYDYITRNHVAVIHESFAYIRNLSIGDTITLTLRDLEFGIFPFPFEWPGCWWGIQSGSETWQEHSTYETTFEIVGLFSYGRRERVYPSQTKVLFVPESTIPSGFVETEDGRICKTDYSFVLTSTRYQDRFLQENLEKIQEFDLEIHFIEHGAENFWQSVGPILRTLRFNAFLFTAVFLVFVLLISPIYLWHRKREFVILRALGLSTKKSIYQLCIPIFLMWIPVIIISSVWAWTYAHKAAGITLRTINEMDECVEVMVDAFLPYSWLIGFSFFSFAIIFFVTLLGVLRIANRSVLEGLQGSSVSRKVNKRKKGIKEESGTPDVLHYRTSLEKNNLLNINTRKKNAHKAFRRNIGRRMLRTPLRVLLLMGIIALFMLSVGWLQKAIRQSNAEIDRLYDTTTVRGSIRQLNVDDYSIHSAMNLMIHPDTVSYILDSGFVRNVYFETGHEWAFLIPPGEDGHFPDEIWGEREFGLDDRNRLLATNDLIRFVDNNNAPTDVFGTGREPLLLFTDTDEILLVEFEPIIIEFLHGFDETIFSNNSFIDFNAVVPVILKYEVMKEAGLSLGDMAFISHNFRNIEPWTMMIKVAGFYTGRIHRPFGYDSIIMPHSAMKLIRKMMPIEESAGVSMTGYIAFDFEVNPVRNRELVEFREILNDLVPRNRAGAVRLTYDLFDSELEFVVRQMEQNLQLLRLLYPIAVILFLIISAGFPILIQLQNVRNIALMRVLGGTRKEVHKSFISEQIIISLIGLSIGVFLLYFTGNIFAIDMSLIVFAVLCFITTITGSSIGILVIINCSPLGMLQVKE